MIEKTKKIILTSLLILLLVPNVLEASFVDMPNNWSTQALEEAVHNGLLQGYKGKIYPDKALTRAEFAAVMTRALGLSTQANISKYKDVPKGKWYHDDMARAVYAGIFEGDHDRLHPERNVTREEAFTALGRSFILEGETNRLNRFKDGNQVANWAQYRINGLIDGAYISGDHLRRLNPRKQITRAEFSKIMDNIVKEYVTRPGVYNSLSERGNILVNRPGVTLKDMTLKGDLVIADGVADDEVTLSNMDMRGRLVLRGSSKLNIVDNSRIEEALVVNKLGESYIYVEKGSRVNLIVLKSKTQIVGDGRVDKIHVSKDADGSKIEVDGAEVTVEEGANNVTDKHGDQIKPGGTTDLDQGGEDSKADALARLIDLRREAGKMRNADLTAVVNQYSKVNNKSSIAEINRATNAIERKIEEVRRAIIARLKSYEKPIEAEVRQIPKQESPANLEREVNRVLRTYVKSPVKAKAQYVLVESKMEITLEESTVEHKFGIRLGAKDFIDSDKVALRRRLEKSLDKTKKMNDMYLNEIVSQEEYLELKDKLYREETSLTESPTNITEVRSKVISLEDRIASREIEIREQLKEIGLKLEGRAQDFESIDNNQTLEEFVDDAFLDIREKYGSAAEMTKYNRNDREMRIFITLEEAGIKIDTQIRLKNIPEVDPERTRKIRQLKNLIKVAIDRGYADGVKELAEDYSKITWTRVDLDKIQEAIDSLSEGIDKKDNELRELKNLENSIITENINKGYIKSDIIKLEEDNRINPEGDISESKYLDLDRYLGNIKISYKSIFGDEEDVENSGKSEIERMLEKTKNLDESSYSRTIQSTIGQMNILQNKIKGIKREVSNLSSLANKLSEPSIRNPIIRELGRYISENKDETLNNNLVKDMVVKTLRGYRIKDLGDIRVTISGQDYTITIRTGTISQTEHSMTLTILKEIEIKFKDSRDFTEK